MFAPGQHVIYVGSYEPMFSVTPEGRKPSGQILTKGNIYIVSEVYLAGWVPWVGAMITEPCIRVDEYPCAAFLAAYFRPISKTSIEIVESLMAPVNAPGKVTEPA